MARHGVSLRVLHPEPLPPERQKDLNCDTFWKLMDRWEVPTDRTLTLIGHEAEPVAETERPSFPLSDEQAKVVSCLLEIELTLTVAGAGRARSRTRRWLGSGVAGIVRGDQRRRTERCRSTLWGDVIRAGPP